MNTLPLRNFPSPNARSSQAMASCRNSGVALQKSDRPRPRDGLGDSSVRRRFGVSGALGDGWPVDRPSRLAFSRLLFLSRVARSGLLAVPGERYMERRFVCKSVSSSAS